MHRKNADASLKCYSLGLGFRLRLGLGLGPGSGLQVVSTPEIETTQPIFETLMTELVKSLSNTYHQHSTK